MIEYGFGSNAWLAKMLVAHASERLLKSAVIELIGELTSPTRTEPMSSFEIIDRLLQVSAVGTYTAPDDVEIQVREALGLAKETEEMESVDLEEFQRKMDEFLRGEGDDDDN